MLCYSGQSSQISGQSYSVIRSHHLKYFDWQAMQDELESLREDHLIALRREVEASIAALKSLEQVRW